MRAPMDVVKPTRSNQNTINGGFSSICGGQGNTLDASFAVIGGGQARTFGVNCAAVEFNQVTDDG